MKMASSLAYILTAYRQHGRFSAGSGEGGREKEGGRAGEGEKETGME